MSGHTDLKGVTMEALGAWLLRAPLWQVGLALYVGMLVSAMLGSALRTRRSASDSDGAGSNEGYVVTAVTGLFALLVGFTFSQAIDRFDNRRDMVLAEGEAVRALYARRPWRR